MPCAPAPWRRMRAGPESTTLRGAIFVCPPVLVLARCVAPVLAAPWVGWIFGLRAVFQATAPVHPPPPRRRRLGTPELARRASSPPPYAHATAVFQARRVRRLVSPCLPCLLWSHVWSVSSCCSDLLLLVADLRWALTSACHGVGPSSCEHERYQMRTPAANYSGSFFFFLGCWLSYPRAPLPARACGWFGTCSLCVATREFAVGALEEFHWKLMSDPFVAHCMVQVLCFEELRMRTNAGVSATLARPVEAR